MTKFSLKKAAAAVLAVIVLAGAGQALKASESAISQVRAHQTDVWRIWVPAGTHRVTVEGDHDTDLDLYIADDFGNVLAYDNDSTDYCIGSFFVSRGQFVRIYIRNLGDVYNEYELSVN